MVSGPPELSSPPSASKLLSIAFVSSGLGSTSLGFLGYYAVDCGPIESLSIRLPCALSFDQQTAVSLGVDWITSVCKWYLDHGCELPGDAFSLRDLLYPKPVAGASTAASATPFFNGPARIPQLPQTRWVLSRSAHIRWLLPTSGGQSPTSGGSIPSIRAWWK
ncbi:hypothetical protein B0H10DRAFT_2203757 [Mycena sp. CBHHK59/15]|nr:hypothetical protein B0H10DRAFT_2203757 [Mycena sp. CBHHK59/15]